MAGPITARYDTIGVGYDEYRRREPRFAAAIDAAVGEAATVLDVGSGTGSYQPDHGMVIAVEPSRTMIGQRAAAAAPVAQGVAEHLPFPDDAFDVALAVLTVHHWQHKTAGLRELARVASRQVVLTFDPAFTNQFWLVTEYLPELGTANGHLSDVEAVGRVLEVVEVATVPVPWDCADGLMGAYWRRPAMYLDAGARRAISGFHRVDPRGVSAAMARLEQDLASGRWARRHHDLLELDEMDFGLRLVVCHGLRRDLRPA